MLKSWSSDNPALKHAWSATHECATWWERNLRRGKRKPVDTSMQHLGVANDAARLKLAVSISPTQWKWPHLNAKTPLSFSRRLANRSSTECPAEAFDHTLHHSATESVCKNIELHPIDSLLIFQSLLSLSLSLSVSALLLVCHAHSRLATTAHMQTCVLWLLLQTTSFCSVVVCCHCCPSYNFNFLGRGIRGESKPRRDVWQVVLQKQPVKQVDHPDEPE